MNISCVSEKINLPASPATRDNPRIVTEEMIEAFERSNPALEGISAHMLDIGIWVLETSDDAKRRGFKQ